LTWALYLSVRVSWGSGVLSCPKFSSEGTSNLFSCVFVALKSMGVSGCVYGAIFPLGPFARNCPCFLPFVLGEIGLQTLFYFASTSFVSLSFCL
jgi:hypothetical protein